MPTKTKILSFALSGRLNAETFLFVLIEILAGSRWQEKLSQWIEGAGAVLVIWTDSSAQSSWVIAEASKAGNKLVSATLAGMAVVPSPFQDLMTVDLHGWSGDPSDPRLDQLGKALLDKLSTHPQPATSSGSPGQDNEQGTASQAIDLDLALVAAANIVDGAGRSTALIDLARPLADSDPARARVIIQQALSSADGITDPAERVTVFASAAEVLNRIDPERAKGVVNQALSSAHSITDEAERARILSVLTGVPNVTDPKLVVNLNEYRARTTSGTVPEGAGLPQETIFDFSTDTPGLGDNVRTSDDQLGIEDDVRILCQLALARSTKPPLAIGLFGDWGTGKSFFMRRMHTRIDEMQDEAKVSLARGGTSLYCDNVVQVSFNAWHYVDSNLWASIMTRIFESLKESTSDKARDYIFSRLESTQGQLNQARRDKSDANKQIDALQRKQRQLEEARSAISGQEGKSVSQLINTLTKLELPGDEPKSSLPEGVRTLADLHEAAQGARSTARLIRQLLDWWPFRLLLVMAVLVVLGGLGVIAAGGSDLVIRMVSVAAVVVPTVVAAAGVTWRRFRKIVDFASQADDVEQWITTQLEAIDERDRALASDRQQAEDLADQAARTIDAVRAGNLIRQYVEDRVTNEAYRDQLGVISLVRNDLQRLSELCSPTVDGPGVFSMTARFDIQRIVLYIDDLDRCPPSRVVEVLQAVHLLLAFPLFVVVAGVDSRWLITSLKIHYRNLLYDEEGDRQKFGNDSNEWNAFPADYLDKIFQIPFALHHMSDSGYRALMRNLVPVKLEAADPDQPPSVARPGDLEESVGDSGQLLTLNPGQATLLQAQEMRRFAIEGEPLAVRFVIDGRRLVVVTSAGIWVWNQGAASDSREISAPIQEVWFSPDGGRIMYETGDEWVTLDVATGDARTYQRPAGVLTVAVGNEAHEIVYATENKLTRLCGHVEQSKSWSSNMITGLLIVENRLLVSGSFSLRTLWLPQLADVTQLTTDELEPMPIVDMTLDHRDRTLYTLHTGHVRTWLWSGDNWVADSTLEVPPGGGPTDRLFAGQGGAFIRRAHDLLHITRQKPSVSPVGIVTGPEARTAELFADPSTARFVLWSGSTVVVGEQDGTAAAERARFEVVQVKAAALSPSGSLVATVDAGTCQLRYIGAAFVDEDVSELELAPGEAEFIAGLGPVVPTARAAKRLVNVYRVLRASKVGRQKLQDPASGDYKVALLLLSLVTGWPHLAHFVLHELDSSTSQTWTDLLETVCATQSTRDRSEFAHGPGRDDENIEILRAFQKLANEAPAELDRYRAWAPDIRRFSIPADDHALS